MLQHLTYFYFYTIIIFLSVFYVSCGSSRVATSDSDSVKDPENVQYSITYLIHGDANYLYHDSTGIGHQADEKVLEEAKRVAQKAKTGEIFIFHQRPEKKILWLFPKKDRLFMYYKNGKLIHKKSYSPSSTVDVFSTESQLYSKYKSTNAPDSKNILLYFGHEIPLKNERGYFNSIPEIEVNTKTFTEGLKSMLPGPKTSFDLTVLSTCNNGSPNMVHSLQPITHTLLASPQNLHLSHIDTDPLLQLEENSKISPQDLAKKLAQQTYQRLEQSIQTVISLTIYDMEEIDSLVTQADSAYSTYLKKQSTPKPGADNVDCTTLPVFKLDMNYSKGVMSWYRPPRFGRKANKKTHSGWGCKD